MARKKKGEGLSDAWGARDKPLTKADMVLLRRATRQRWGVPDPIKTDALLRLQAIVRGRKVTAAEITAAVKTLVEMEKADLAYRQHAFERLKFNASQSNAGGPTFAEIADDEPDVEPRRDEEAQGGVPDEPGEV